MKTASPDISRNSNDANNGVDVAAQTQNFQQYSSPWLAFLSATASAAADLAAMLAIVPFIQFTGPSRADTIYNIAAPVAILTVMPLIACLTTSWRDRLAPEKLTMATTLARLTLLSYLFANLGNELTTVSLLVSSLAFVWGLRLLELAIARQQAMFDRLAATIVPIMILLASLKFFPLLQPYLIPATLTLYSGSLVLQFINLIVENVKTTGGTMTRNTESDVVSLLESSPKSTSTIIYEVLLTCLASLMVTSPVILLLTDQALDGPMMRWDVFVALSGFMLGAIASAAILTQVGTRSFKFPIQEFRVERLHIILTICFGALLFSKTSPPALASLFFTCGTAGAIVIAIDKTRKQKAFFLALLVVASACSYVYLTPLQSSWMPIHALRSLVGYLFVAAAASLMFWSRSRVSLFRLVAYVIPLNEKIRWVHPAAREIKKYRCSPLSMYFTRDISLPTALIIGWRLRTTIVLLAEEQNKIVRAIFRFGNIKILTLNQWFASAGRLGERLNDGEQFLVYDLRNRLRLTSQDDGESVDVFETKSAEPRETSFAPPAGVGLIQKAKSENTVVISPMVPIA